MIAVQVVLKVMFDKMFMNVLYIERNIQSSLKVFFFFCYTLKTIGFEIRR